MLGCAIAVAGAGAAACGSRKLDRSEALDVLAKSDTVRRTVWASVDVSILGHTCAETRGNATPQARRMEQEGAFQFVENAATGCQFAMTEKGKAMRQAEGWEHDFRASTSMYGLDRDRWIVPVGRVAVAHVDGVAQSESEPTSATVEYTWREQLTARGEALRAAAGKGVPDSATATAQLRRYDDGWRVVGAQ